LSHILVIDYLVWQLGMTTSVQLGLDKKIATLGVNPHLIVLHHNLLENRLGKLLLKLYRLQSEGVVQ
jgi:hypothetical protein